MTRGTTVTVHGKREADFERVFGTTTVHVQGWAPHHAQLPGHDEPQLVFLLDLEWVKEAGHRANLVAFLAERFEQDPAFVDRELERMGMPILARDCTMSTTDMSWL